MSIQVRSNEKPQAPVQANEASQGGVAESAKPESVGISEGSESLSALDTNVSEQKQPSDSETESTEAKKEEETEENGEPKKKGGFQRRIDKLNAKNAQAQQELEYWRSMALKNAAGESKANINPKPTEPAPINSTEGKPIPEHFETHSEYVEALTDWKTERKFQEREQKAQKERIDQEQSKIVSTYADRMKAFSTKNPDFQEVLGEVDHVPLSPALRDIILNSENGPEIAYELAKVPGEYERIAKLPPLACAREMGRFEARLSSSLKASAARNENERADKKITKAPAPIAPVGTGGKGSTGKTIFDPSLSQREYEALRREQMKKRRQA